MRRKKKVQGIEYDRIIDCTECEGTGNIENETCLVCDGTGKMYDNDEWKEVWRHP